MTNFGLTVDQRRYDITRKAPAYFDYENRETNTHVQGVIWDGKYYIGSDAADAHKVFNDKTKEVDPPVPIEDLMNELREIEDREFEALFNRLVKFNK